MILEMELLLVMNSNIIKNKQGNGINCEKENNYKEYENCENKCNNIKIQIQDIDVYKNLKIENDIKIENIINNTNLNNIEKMNNKITQYILIKKEITKILTK